MKNSVYVLDYTLKKEKGEKAKQIVECFPEKDKKDFIDKYKILCSDKIKVITYAI